MAILHLRLATAEEVDTYWNAHSSIDETYSAKPTDGTEWFVADFTFSFDALARKSKFLRRFKLVNLTGEIHGCAVLSTHIYQDYKIGEIRRLVTDLTPPFWRAFGVCMMERLIKYAKINGYHILVAWGRNTDYYLNFDFDLIKPSLSMLALRLRATTLTDDDLVAASGYLGGPTTTSSTTTSTTTSSISTTSTMSTVSTTISTTSTMSTLTTTTTTTTDGA